MGGSLYHEPVTYRVDGLVLSAVQLVAVVEDVVVRRIEAGLDTVLYHLAGSRRRLQLLDLLATCKIVRLLFTLT